MCREWVESFGLEFYPLGGDPKKLSDYIVRNRGVVPRSLEDLQSAEEVKQVVTGPAGDAGWGVLFGCRAKPWARVVA